MSEKLTTQLLEKLAKPYGKSLKPETHNILKNEIKTYLSKAETSCIEKLRQSDQISLNPEVLKKGLEAMAYDEVKKTLESDEFQRRCAEILEEIEKNDKNEGKLNRKFDSVNDERVLEALRMNEKYGEDLKVLRRWAHVLAEKQTSHLWSNVAHIMGKHNRPKAHSEPKVMPKTIEKEKDQPNRQGRINSEPKNKPKTLQDSLKTIDNKGQNDEEKSKTEEKRGKKEVPKIDLKKPEEPSRQLTVVPPFLFHQLNTPQLEKFNKIRDIVDKAMNGRKIFNVSGNYVISRILYNRGWVEKVYTSTSSSVIQQQAEQMSLYELVERTSHKDHGHIYHRILRSKLVGNNYVCDFFWNPRPNVYQQILNVQKPVFINHLRKRGQFDYCTKIGLAKSLRALDKNETKFPRTFILHEGQEMDAFIYDFRITACLSLLKWFMDKLNAEEVIISENGKVPIDAFYFALFHAIGFIRRNEEVNYTPPAEYPQDTWNVFIDQYYYLIYCNRHFSIPANAKDKPLHQNLSEMKRKTALALSKAAKHRMEIDWDGIHNVWILKPDRRSRGIGIQVCRKMSQIKELVGTNNNLRYVAQKYIETPLLIHNTKFDIRQWILISNSTHLTIWMYKSCYLRFSSQQFDLKRLHESVHLTNNSVQCKYPNLTANSNLPPNKMWDLDTFKKYLDENGNGSAWDEIIYPSMKRSIINVLVSERDYLDERPNTFEIYGVDFMVTPNFQTWLIEINSHPALAHTTSVTTKLCPIMLEDMLKVVLDGSKNFNVPTGDYELIYKGDLPKHTPENGDGV